MELKHTKPSRIPLVLSIAALVAAVLIVRQLVIANRHTGAMTPIEAQAMDMTSMKPPPGVHPVAVETVGEGSASGRITAPGTVAALSDEDVVARIAGRVKKVLVYPGDHVKAGQLLATLDADEIAAEAAAARLESTARGSVIAVAQREVERLQAERTSTAAEVAAHAAHERETRAARTAQAAEVAEAREDWKAKQAEIEERRAELTYSESDLSREKKLYAAGAISRDEYEQSIQRRDTAAAAVRAAEADSEAARRRVDAAEARVLQADSAVAVAIGEHTAARFRVTTMDKAIAKAREEVRSARATASAIAQGARAADVIAGYRQLRALNSGVVSERLVSPGSLVQEGHAILKLKVMNRVRVQAKVPGRYAGQITEGSAIVIRVGEKTRTGKVSSVFPVQDSSTRTFIVESVVENSDSLLQPGAFVQVELRTRSQQSGISVPAAAVQSDQNGDKFVWVVNKRKSQGKTDWTCTMHPEISESGPGICPICKMDLTPRESTAEHMVSRRKINMGARAGAIVVVTAGLRPGEQVVYAGFENLIEGSPVEPVPWGENGPLELPKGAGNE